MKSLHCPLCGDKLRVRIAGNDDHPVHRRVRCGTNTLHPVRDDQGAPVGYVSPAAFMRDGSLRTRRERWATTKGRSEYRLRLECRGGKCLGYYADAWAPTRGRALGRLQRNLRRAARLHLAGPR